jgi:hypothetical protein
MEDFDAERAKILIQAMCDIMQKLRKSHYVEDVFSATAIWDEAECDGSCWYDEARALLGIDAED